MDFSDCQLPLSNEHIEIDEMQWNRPNVAHQRQMFRDNYMERLHFTPTYARNSGLRPYCPRRLNECFPQSREYFPEETVRTIETFSPNECNAYIKNLPNHVKYNTSEIPLEFSPPYNPVRRFSRRYSHPYSVTHKAIHRNNHLCAMPSYKQIRNNQEMQSIPNCDTFNEVSINEALPISYQEQFPLTFKAGSQNCESIQNVSEEDESDIPSFKNDIANITFPIQNPAQVIAPEFASKDRNAPKWSSVCQETVSNSLSIKSTATEINPLQTAMNDASVSNIKIPDVTEKEVIPGEIEKVLNSADENAVAVYFLKRLYPDLQPEDQFTDLISDNDCGSAVLETSREDLQSEPGVNDSEIYKNIQYKNLTDLEMSLTTITDKIVNSDANNLDSERMGVERLREKDKISDDYNNSVEERKCLEVSSLENVIYSQDKCNTETKYLDAHSMVQALNFQNSNNLVKEQKLLNESSKDEIRSLGEKYKSENEELNVIPSNTSEITNVICFGNKTEMNINESDVKLDNSKKQSALNNEFHVTPNVTSNPKFIFHAPVINISQQNQISTDNPHRFFDRSGNLLDRTKTDSFHEKLSKYLAANIMNFLCGLEGNSSTSLLNAGDHSSEVEVSHRNLNTLPDKKEKTEKISSEYAIVSNISNANSATTNEIIEKADEFEYSSVLNSEALSSKIESTLSSITNYILQEPTTSSITLLDNIFESDNEDKGPSHFDLTSDKTSDTERTIKETSKTILEKYESLSQDSLNSPLCNRDNTGETLNYGDDVKKDDNSNERLAQHTFHDVEIQTHLTSYPYRSINSFYMCDTQTQWNKYDACDNFSDNRIVLLSNEKYNEHERNFRKRQQNSSNRKAQKLQSTEIKCKKSYPTKYVATDKKKKETKKVTFCTEISQVMCENPIISKNLHQTKNYPQGILSKKNNYLTKSNKTNLRSKQNYPTKNIASNKKRKETKRVTSYAYICQETCKNSIISADVHQTIKNSQRMFSKKNNHLTKSNKTKNLYSKQKSTRTRTATKRELDQKQPAEQKRSQVRLRKTQFHEKAAEKLVPLPSRKNWRTTQVSDKHTNKTGGNSTSKTSMHRNKTFYKLRKREKKQ